MNLACSCLLFLALLVPAAPTSAQNAAREEAAPINNIFKISPFHFTQGTLFLSYERMLSQGRYSLMYSGGLTSHPLPVINGIESGFQNELQFRRYILTPKNVPVGQKNFLYFKGMYAGLVAGMRYRQQTLAQNGDNRVSISTYTGGVVLGTQFALGNRLFLDVFAGGGYQASDGQFDPTTYFGYNPGSRRGFFPKGGFQLGIGF